MKIVKGIAIYTLIILGAITMLGLILMGAMFIFPKFSLFGYNFQYKSFHITNFSDLVINEYQTNGLKIDADSPVVNLYITSGNYDLVITPSNNQKSQATSYVNSNYVGFVETQGGAFETSLTTQGSVAINTETGKSELNITLHINQPKGAVAFRDNNIFYLNLPYLLTKDGAVITYNMFVNSDNGNVILQNLTTEDVFDKPLNANKINISTNTGDVLIKGLRAKSSDGKLVEEKNVTLNSINISTKGGVVDLTNFDSITVKEKLVLNSSRADYKFKQLYAEKGLEVIGTNVRFEADIVTAKENGFIYKSTTGGLDVNILNCTNLNLNSSQTKGQYQVNDKGNVYDVLNSTNWQTGYKNYETTILTESAQIDIDELIGKFGIENEYGNITIKHCTNQGSIRNVHGNVTINTSGYFLDQNAGTADVVYAPASSLIIYNTYGKITVGKYFQNGVFTTEKGDIEANSAYSTLNGDNHYYSKITTKDGNIIFNSDGNACSIVATGKGNITASITNVTKYSETDGLVFETEEKLVNYGLKVNTGELNIVLPSISTYYTIKASGDILGYIVTTTDIVNNNEVSIGDIQGKTIIPYVRLIGGNINLRGNY